MKFGHLFRLKSQVNNSNYIKQEDKDLLLKDLCARLPYGVIVAQFDEDCRRTSIALPLVSLENDFSFYGNLKPYLFPLSSMTDEQYKEYTDMGYSVTERWWSMANYHQIEWFNKNHFDYRGLIEKGLAIDATGLSVYN